MLVRGQDCSAGRLDIRVRTRKVGWGCRIQERIEVEIGPFEAASWGVERESKKCWVVDCEEELDLKHEREAGSSDQHNINETRKVELTRLIPLVLTTEGSLAVSSDAMSKCNTAVKSSGATWSCSCSFLASVSDSSVFTSISTSRGRTYDGH
jgi:hypothetical protein